MDSSRSRYQVLMNPCTIELVHELFHLLNFRGSTLLRINFLVDNVNVLAEALISLPQAIIDRMQGLLLKNYVNGTGLSTDNITRLAAKFAGNRSIRDIILRANTVDGVAAGVAFMNTMPRLERLIVLPQDQSRNPMEEEEATIVDLFTKALESHSLIELQFFDDRFITKEERDHFSLLINKNRSNWSKANWEPGISDTFDSETQNRLSHVLESNPSKLPLHTVLLTYSFYTRNMFRLIPPWLEFSETSVVDDKSPSFIHFET